MQKAVTGAIRVGRVTMLAIGVGVALALGIATVARRGAGRPLQAGPGEREARRHVFEEAERRQLTAA